MEKPGIWMRTPAKRRHGHGYERGRRGQAGWVAARLRRQQLEKAGGEERQQVKITHGVVTRGF